MCFRGYGTDHKLDALINVVNDLRCEMKEGFRHMTTIIDTLNASIDDLSTAIDEAVADFSTLLQELQAAIAAEDPTAIQASIDRITAKTAALKTAAEAAVPPVPPAV